MQTLGVSAAIPAPPWTEYHKIAADSESLRQRSLSQQGTDLFMRAYVPKGQSFDDWQQRYEVSAEAPVVGTALEYRDAYAMAFRKDCQNAALAPVLQDDDRHVFILFCPAFLEQPDKGAYVIGVVARRGETRVQISYRHIVPAFDISDRSSFPKSEDDLKHLVQYLNKAHLLPS